MALILTPLLPTQSDDCMAGIDLSPGEGDEGDEGEGEGGEGEGGEGDEEDDDEDEEEDADEEGDESADEAGVSDEERAAEQAGADEESAFIKLTGPRGARGAADASARAREREDEDAAEVDGEIDGRFGERCVSEWRNKWQGAVLGDDGLIYCIPCDAMHVLVIHPETAQLELLGLLPAGRKQYQGGYKAPNGSIWGLPESAHRVLRITTTST